MPLRLLSELHWRWSTRFRSLVWLATLGTLACTSTVYGGRSGPSLEGVFPLMVADWHRCDGTYNHEAVNAWRAHWGDYGVNGVVSWGKGSTVAACLDDSLRSFNEDSSQDSRPDFRAVRDPRDPVWADDGNPRLLALSQPDEPDAYGGLAGNLETLRSNYGRWSGRHLVYLNFGGCDLITTGQDYASAAAYGDWLANDIYPFSGYLGGSHDGVDMSTRRGDVTLVGLALDHLKAIAPDKPLFAWIETCVVDASIGGGRAPTGPEVRAMMWNAIIHGARGLLFWAHLAGTDERYVTSQEVLTEIGAQNAVITALAPVLQGAIDPDGIGATVSAGLEVAWRDGPTGKYFFVLNHTSGPIADATITLGGVGDPGSATVYGEGRDVSVLGNVITDDFDPYAVHIYVVN